MDANFDGESLLVTGGTGSFGRKFVELVLRKHRPKRLVVFSRDELKQQEMRQQFPEAPGSPVQYVQGDVRDRNRLNRAFAGIDMVIHAAALKHVSACESNPFEAVQTNVLGAQNVIEAALDARVKKVMAISTDKAVNPVSHYGATKLCAERLFLHANSDAGDGGTRFSCTRYGNVVGSRGSVLPIFLEQRASGTVTITDPRVTRFWLTQEQGAEFVIRCLGSMRGGEIFVPKMASMSLVEMAKAVAPHCLQKFIGLQPGEKVHEELISEDEARHTLETEDMFVVLPTLTAWSDVNWPEGRPLPDGFRYTSANNPKQLGVADLFAMMGWVEAGNNPTEGPVASA